MGLRKIFHRGQRLAKVHSGEEILPKVSTPWAGCTQGRNFLPKSGGTTCPPAPVLSPRVSSLPFRSRGPQSN